LLVEVQVARNLEFQSSVLLHQPASHLGQNAKLFGRDPNLSRGASAIMASSSRRVFIGYLVLAKAAKAGGDQTTPSRPPRTATPMIGNSGAPLEHLASVTVCKEFGSKVGFTSRWARWAGSGSEPRGPQPTPKPTVTVCKAVLCFFLVFFLAVLCCGFGRAESASRLGTYFFRKWGRGGRGPGAGPGVPNPPPGPPRRLAAKNGKGELCTALIYRAPGCTGCECDSHCECEWA
jgi:hypothetical protein